MVPMQRILAHYTDEYQTEVKERNGSVNPLGALGLMRERFVSLEPSSGCFLKVPRFTMEEVPCDCSNLRNLSDRSDVSD